MWQQQKKEQVRHSLPKVRHCGCDAPPPPNECVRMCTVFTPPGCKHNKYMYIHEVSAALRLKGIAHFWFLVKWIATDVCTRMCTCFIHEKKKKRRNARSAGRQVFITCISEWNTYHIELRMKMTSFSPCLHTWTPQDEMQVILESAPEKRRLCHWGSQKVNALSLYRTGVVARIPARTVMFVCLCAIDMIDFAVDFLLRVAQKRNFSSFFLIFYFSESRIYPELVHC